ncbi:MAG: DUF3276 family protein [Chitinophagales bacterium]
MENRFNRDEVFSKKIRAGRRRTYFFDVRTTRSNDYFITITESKKRFDDDSYERHKLHLYKEDFNKFMTGLEETVNHVKTELMPEYDFDEYTRRPYDEDGGYNAPKGETAQVQEEVEVEGEDEVEMDDLELGEDSFVEGPTDDADNSFVEGTADDDEDDLKWD